MNDIALRDIVWYKFQYTFIIL